MIHWKEVLTQITPDADARMAELRGRLYSQLGGVGPVKVIAFRGYGSTEWMYLRGRVIEEKENLTGQKNDQVWDKLVDIYTHASSACVPNACLAVRFQGKEQVIRADEDGFFEVRFENHWPLAGDRLWHPIEIHLLDPIPTLQSRYPIKSVGQVLVPSATARFAVVSSIDSLALRAGAQDLARSAFLRTPRLVAPGEAALYRALYAGASGKELNPLFYLSASSGQIYDLLIQHINLQNMPSGPVLFPRPVQAGRTGSSRMNKIDTLRQVIELYPRLPFLFIGDSQQDDPETFTVLAKEYPGRIPTIYIRDSSHSPARAEALRALAERARPFGAELRITSSAISTAQHAARLGYLSPTAIPALIAESQREEM